MQNGHFTRFDLLALRGEGQNEKRASYVRFSHFVSLLYNPADGGGGGGEGADAGDHDLPSCTAFILLCSSLHFLNPTGGLSTPNRSRSSLTGVSHSLSQ